MLSSLGLDRSTEVLQVIPCTAIRSQDTEITEQSLDTITTLRWEIHEAQILLLQQEAPLVINQPDPHLAINRPVRLVHLPDMLS